MIRQLLSRILPVLLFVLVLAAPQAQAQVTPTPQTCDVSTVTGKYLVTVTGSYYDSQYYVYLIAATGFYQFDGAGGFTGSDTISNDGTITRRTITGTYQVNADCTGNMTITGSDKLTLHADFAVSTAKNISMVGTDSGTILSGSAAKQ